MKKKRQEVGGEERASDSRVGRRKWEETREGEKIFEIHCGNRMEASINPFILDTRSDTLRREMNS